MTPQEIRQFVAAGAKDWKLPNPCSGRQLAQEAYNRLKEKLKDTPYEDFRQFEKTLYNNLPKRVQESAGVKRFWELVLQALDITPARGRYERDNATYDALLDMLAVKAKSTKKKVTKKKATKKKS